MEQRDLSKEFKDMSRYDFDEFLFNLNIHTKDQIIITILSEDIREAKRLKAIKEDALYTNFTFNIEITATIEEYKEELNVFASGIKRNKKAS